MGQPVVFIWKKSTIKTTGCPKMGQPVYFKSPNET